MRDLHAPALGLALILLLYVTPFCCAASGDAPGSKDHPLLSRYPGSTITHYSQKQHDIFYVLACPGAHEEIHPEKSRKMKVEGKVTKIQYSIPRGRGAYEVFTNYEQAIKQAGFEILCEGKAKGVRGFLDQVCGFWDVRLYTAENPASHFYISARNPSGDVLLSVYVGEGYSGRPPVAAVGIVEARSMETGLITARIMKNRLEGSGHIALYGIRFDFDKATIKPASEATIREIATLLRDDPAMAIYIVGHTDSTGKVDYNMDLSRRRAQAVLEELASKYGISKDRLKAFGAGPLCPVASNKTEDGRAKNRRVEIVRQ